MIIIKYTSLLLIFIITFLIGYFISKRYSNRVIELKELQIALDIIENKIKFTYEPLKDIFIQMESLLKCNISKIFKQISENLKNDNVEKAFSKAIEGTKTNLLEEDLEILRNLSKLLGKTDKEGQVSQLELTSTFIKTQIKKAEKEEEKNSKLYKTLGATVGLAFVIILV